MEKEPVIIYNIEFKVLEIQTCITGQQNLEEDSH
jgi:hypothetical protein